MAQLCYIMLLVFYSVVAGQDNFSYPRETDSTNEDSEWALKLPYIEIESPEGSGRIIKESLIGSPNKPIPVEENHVKFYFYTKKINGTQFGKNNISIINFDPAKETVFIIHGWRNSYQSPMPQTVKDAYLQTRDVNVVVVDWGETANDLYIHVRWSILNVGQIIAKFIEYMTSNVGLQLNNTALVGHSLGAHISGVAGDTLNGEVDHLVGLDPAGALFLLTPSEDKLSRDDAKFVQVIHTAKGIIGYPCSLGDADYWPNGGGPFQPGCSKISSCAHSRSYQYYVESLTSGGFLATKCRNYRSFKRERCKSNKKTTMGNDAIDRSTGDFFLTTNSKAPYAKSQGK